MRKDVIFAILGFLVGAAAIAGGDEKDDLRDELRALQREAARVQLRDWDSSDIPAADGRGNELGIFPIGDLSVPRPRNLPSTELAVLESQEQPCFGGVAEDSYLPFGTGEEIIELLRAATAPGAWEEGHISVDGGMLLTLTSPNTNGLVREELETRLRPMAHRGVSVDFEVLEVDGKTARILRSLEGGVLNNVHRTALNEAVKAGSARRIMALRGVGTLGVQFTVTHGGEIAFLGDTDVEVAQKASTADPVVMVAQTGAQLAVRAVSDERGEFLGLGLELRMRELEEMRRHETRQNGVLDQPVFRTQSVKTDLRVRSGAWVVALTGNAVRADSGATGTGDGERATRHRVFLVRGRTLDRVATAGGVR